MLYDPFSAIGHVQSEVHAVKRQLDNKAESYEINEIHSKMASLERTMREISSTLNELQSRLEDAENKIIELDEK